MKRFCNWYEHRGKMICRNYGGWVIVDGYDYNIYKALIDCKNAIDKKHDGVYSNEPRIIGKMTDEQFINALV